MADILVVEDEPHILRFVTANLRARGHTVRAAAAGEDALALLQEASPDLLILDIRLPGISGWDLLEHITPDPRFRALPVLVATASPADAGERRRHFPQIAGIVLKPMSVEQLLASVEQALAPVEAD